MIYAYDEMYLDDAMKNLGEAADYAASCCNLNIDAFLSCSQQQVSPLSLKKATPDLYPDFRGQNLYMRLLTEQDLK